MNRPSHLLIVALALAAAVAGFLVARGTVEREPEPLQLEQATVLNQPRPLPSFELLDHHGNTVGRERLEGEWQLLFFGFTHCPDICPVTLQRLAQLRRQLTAEDGITPPGVVFVSVDPARDDPDAVAAYIDYFDPEFLGLTGDANSIDAFTRDLGVAVRVGEPDERGNYNVDHTTAVFLLNPDAELVALFTGQHDAGTIASGYRRIVAAAR